MKPIKYSKADARIIDLGTKVITKYPTPTRMMDIGRMTLNGRHPVDKNTFMVEHDCSFVFLITRGSGTVYAGENIFDVTEGDVVFVPAENKFAVEGEMEYVEVGSPAFYPEQVEEIKI